MNVNKLFAVTCAFAIAASMVLAGSANATEPSSMSVSPANVVAGQPVTISVYCFQGDPRQQLPTTTVVSPGLAHPIQLRFAGSGPVGPRLAGTGLAGNRSGTYTLSFTCYDHWVVTATLSVACPTPTGTATPPTTTTTAPTITTTTTTSAYLRSNSRTCFPTGGTGEQVPVKPKGAPETGGGGMAAVVGTWR